MSGHGAHASPFPCFSAAEMGRRRKLLLDSMAAVEASHLVVYGANRSGSAVGWLTNWPVSREAMVLVDPKERDVLLVQFYNHVPNAREVAKEADVRWGGPSTATTMAELLQQRNATRVAVIGPLTMRTWATLAEVTPLVDLSETYTRLRMIKSEEEIGFLRFAAELTDRGMEALAATARPGVTERELAASVESAYRAEGAVNHVHYFAITDMRTPSQCVPAQQQARRAVSAGDAISAEISASYWDYAGQVLRTFTVDSEPSALYRELHDVADAAFDAIAGVLRAGVSCQELIDAASVIEDAGFTTYDDLVHGFGGGYLPPILSSKSRAGEPIPEMDLQAGMTVVVQPNVITPDETAGVQTGELLLVKEDSWESLHRVERGLRKVG